jgi:hypothetical protein
MSKIGTGEGAQAYGHGLYFAGNPKVAESYRDTLTPGPTLKVNTRDGVPPDTTDVWAEGAFDYLKRFKGDYTKARANLEKDWEPEGVEKMNAALDQLESGGVSMTYEKPQGSLYHVTLSPDEDDLLDWDAPLSQQPEKVRKALEPLRPRIEQGIAEGHISPDYAQSVDQLTGEDIYQLLVSMEPWNGGPRTDQQSATALLRSAGIPGLRYFDGTSRTKGEGTRNYVMFDDKLVNIDKVER